MYLALNNYEDQEGIIIGFSLVHQLILIYISKEITVILFNANNLPPTYADFIIEYLISNITVKSKAYKLSIEKI